MHASAYNKFICVYLPNVYTDLAIIECLIKYTLYNYVKYKILHYILPHIIFWFHFHVSGIVLYSIIVYYGFSFS